MLDKNKSMAGYIIKIIIVGLLITVRTDANDDEFRPLTYDEQLKREELILSTENDRIQSLIDTSKADFDRHYSKNSGDEYAVLNESMSNNLKRQLKSEIEQLSDAKSLVKGEVQFFNDSLELLHEGTVSEGELLSDVATSVKDCDVTIYLLAASFEEIKIGDIAIKLREISDRFVRNAARDVKLSVKIFDDGVLLKYTLGSLEIDEELDLILFNESKEIEFMLCDDTFSWWSITDNFYDVLGGLKERYNEEFLVLSPLVKYNSGLVLCAPKRDLSLRFIEGSQFNGGDLYLHSISQGALNSKIDEIIYKHEAEKKIIQYNSLGDVRKRGYDTKKLNADVINELHSDEADLSFIICLYYLLSDDELVDDQLLYNICKDIQEAIPLSNPLQKEIYVRFFNVSEHDKGVVLDLYKEEGITTDSIKLYDTLLLTLEDLDVNTELFNYLYIYGKEIGSLIEVDELLNDEMPNDFIKKYQIDFPYRQSIYFPAINEL